MAVGRWLELETAGLVVSYGDSQNHIYIQLSHNLRLLDMWSRAWKHNH